MIKYNLIFEENFFNMYSVVKTGNESDFMDTELHFFANGDAIDISNSCDKIGLFASNDYQVNYVFVRGLDEVIKKYSNKAFGDDEYFIYIHDRKHISEHPLAEGLRTNNVNIINKYVNIPEGRKTPVSLDLLVDVDDINYTPLENLTMVLLDFVGDIHDMLYESDGCRKFEYLQKISDTSFKLINVKNYTGEVLEEKINELNNKVNESENKKDLFKYKFSYYIPRSNYAKRLDTIEHVLVVAGKIKEVSLFIAQLQDALKGKNTTVIDKSSISGKTLDMKCYYDSRAHLIGLNTPYVIPKVGDYVIPSYYVKWDINDKLSTEDAESILSGALKTKSITECFENNPELLKDINVTFI